MARLFATKFSVQDFMGVHFVAIPIQGRMTIITGEADAGKTSVINALWYVFQGEKAVPDMPLRKGAKDLKILVTIEGEKKFVARRDKNRLYIDPAPGYPEWLGTPQKLMESITNKFCQNPIEFVRLGRKEEGAKGRREQVRRLLEAVTLDVDLDEMVRQNKKDFDTRTGLNADIRRLMGEIAAIPLQPGLPADRPDIAAIRKRKQEIDDYNDTLIAQFEERTRLERALAAAEIAENANEEFCGQTRITIENITEDIERLGPALETAEKITRGLEQIQLESDQLPSVPDFSVPVISEWIANAHGLSMKYIDAATDRLEKLKVDLEATRRNLKTAEGQRRGYAEAVTEARLMLDQTPVPVKRDTKALDAELDEAHNINREIDKRDRVEALETMKADAQREADALTRAMELRVEKKNAAIASAKMPIEGLTFTLEEGKEQIFYRAPGSGQSIPLVQQGEATQMKVAIAIGLAANPDLRLIMIPNGEAFDDKRLAELEDLAEEMDFQCIMARVDGSGTVGIFLEQGEVKTVNPPKTRERRKLPIDADKITS